MPSSRTKLPDKDRCRCLWIFEDAWIRFETRNHFSFMLNVCFFAKWTLRLPTRVEIASLPTTKGHACPPPKLERRSKTASSAPQARRWTTLMAHTKIPITHTKAEALRPVLAFAHGCRQPSENVLICKVTKPGYV